MHLRYLLASALLLMLLNCSAYSKPISGNISFNTNSSNVQQKNLTLSRIKARFRRIAYDDLRKGRGRLVGESRQLLEDMISGGAARVFLDGASNQKMDEAESNLRKFIAGLLQQGKKLPNGQVRIDVGTFKAGWFSLCPLYPFC